MADYVAPPMPKVGDKIHTFNGSYTWSGSVRKIFVDKVERGERATITIVRYWEPSARRFRYESLSYWAWQFGLVRPGRCPRPDADGKYPWHKEKAGATQ